MATDLERLVVQLSADVRGFEREMNKINGVTAKQARAAERNMREMQRRFGSIGKGAANAIIRPLTGIAAALGTREIIRYADAWREAQNKINAASDVSGTAARSLSGLAEIATSVRGSLDGVVDLYSRILRVSDTVHASEMEVARATEIVAKAFKAGGASAQEQAAGLIQLGQALGSGFLQGDELRSIRENAPLLADAIAEYMNTTIGGLKDLGTQGELTSDRVFRAIIDGDQKISSAFAKTQATIHDGFTLIRNALTEYIGLGGEATGISERIADALTIIADNFDTVADTALKVAAVIAGALVGRSIGGLLRNLGAATVVVKNFGLALAGISSLSGAAGAFGGLAAAAGPLGALFGGLLAGGLLLYAVRSDEAERSTNDLREAMAAFGVTLPETARAVDGASGAVDRLANSIDEAANEQRRRALQSLREELAALADAPEGPRVRIWGEGGNLTDLITDLTAEYTHLMRAGDDASLAQARVIEGVLGVALAVEQGEASFEDLQEAINRVDLSKVSTDAAELIGSLQDVADAAAPIELTIDVGAADVQLDALREQIARIRQAIIDTGDVDMAAALLPQLDEIEGGLDGTEEGARRAEAAVAALLGGAYSASPILAPLAQVAAGLGVVIERAIAARAALAAMGATGGDSGPTASDRARDAGRARAAEQAAVRDYIAAQRELNARTSEQITLDREMAGVRSQAIADGIALSEQQIEMLAREKIAADEARRGAGRSGGGGGGGGRGTSDRGITSGEDQIRQLERELLLVGQSSEAVARLRAEWAMLDEARRAGIPINAELQALISQQADEVGRLTGELERAQTSQEAFNARMEDIAGTFADAIIAGESLQSALAQIFQQIARDLLQSGILSLLKQLGGAMGMGGGGGGGGGLLSLLFSANGNVVSGPGISAYSGQVVSKPTVFPFAKGIGLMGEAGPEAIMPLTRIGGKLGVRAERGSSPEGLVRVIIEEAPGFATRVRTEAQGVAVQVVSAAARSQSDRDYLRGGG